jgi:parvulin-like peptidyl-prolyl isomerase
VWGFQAQEGEHSPVVEAPGAYFVFRVDSTREGGLPALAAVRGEVEAAVREQKARVEARKLAEEVLAQARAGKGLARAARDLGLTHQVLGPFTRLTAPALGGAAVGAAFALRPGRLAGPVESPDGWFVLEGLGRTPADSAAFVAQLPSLREQSLQNLRQLYLRQYFTSLRQSARIVDNRALLYRTEAQVEAETRNLPAPAY